MKIIVVVQTLFTTLLTFFLIGLIDVVYVLRPDLLFILYGISLFIAILISLYTIKSPRRSAVMTAISLGLIAGFVLDVLGRSFSSEYETFNSFESLIGNKFFEFQSNGCRTVTSTYEGVRVQVLGFGSELDMKQQAIILVGDANSGVTRMVSRDSYQRARRSSERHSIGWIFNYLRNGVFTWDARQAICVH